MSNEEIQYVWAKILANECKEKNNSSFKLLMAISTMSINEFNLIKKILKECNYGEKCFESIGIVCIKNEYLNTINVKYEDIVKLEDIGIMKREIITLDDEIIFNLENKKIKFIKKEEKKSYLKLTKYANFYRFTNIGMELIQLINMETDTDQFKKLAIALKDDYDMITENIILYLTLSNKSCII